MTIRNSRIQTYLGSLLIGILALNGLLYSSIPAQAQNRIVVINADQPNIWTLEQAHYLLAQMHRRNLDLKAKRLDDLDANEINGLRFDVLRTLLEVGLAFNDADRVNNNLAAQNKTFNLERQQELIKRRDQLRQDSLTLASTISQLQSERARATDPKEQARIDAETERQKALSAKVDKDIELTDNELKTLNATTGELKPTTAEVSFDSNKLPKSIFDDAFKDTARTLLERFNQAPKLNASLRLDNFLQMQYEIIAKQLTLLRDEVGPGERLIFLELPQSLNVTHHEANKKWAQSWWKIVGYSVRPDLPKPVKPKEEKPKQISENADKPKTDEERAKEEDRVRQEKIKEQMKVDNPEDDNETTADRVRQVIQAMKNQSNEMNDETIKKITSAIKNQSKEISDETINKIAQVIKDQSNEMSDEKVKKIARVIKDQSNEMSDEAIKKIIQVIKAQLSGVKYISLDELSWDIPTKEGKQPVKVDSRLVRTVDLIPRQSSLNVNDLNLKVSAGALTAVASFLFGFGARVNYQRQHEQLSQFVQQELYSAGFGKGSREFGWTFTPMPGTERLHSGIRTTYAVVIVPANATSIVLESNGCYFPRSAYQPNDFEDTKGDRWNVDDRTSRNCGRGKAFIVPIPGSAGRNDDFFEERLYYRPVGKGERIVLAIRGKRFSSQLGILVNGVPLTQSLGLAQPLILDDSTSGGKASELLEKEKIRGRIERIDTEEIVASFEMPPDFEGTPTITLVAPGKVVDLNRLGNLTINYLPGSSLDRYPGAELADPMFEKVPGVRPSTPPSPAVKIDRVEIYRSATPGNLTAMITGTGFKDKTGASNVVTDVYINGQLLTNSGIKSSQLIRVDFPAPADETIQATLVTANDVFKSLVVENPAYLKVKSVSILSYEAASGKIPAVLVVKLEGIGFTDSLTTSIGEIAVKSATEAILKIKNPDAAVIVTLKDPRTGASVKTVITRKTSPD